MCVHLFELIADAAIELNIFSSYITINNSSSSSPQKYRVAFILLFNINLNFEAKRLLYIC